MNKKLPTMNSRKRLKIYENVNFNELFKTKRAAVVYYLSLERKYLNMMKYYRNKNKTKNDE